MFVYLDTCSIQRPFDDHSQLRIASESEAVLRLIQLAEQGDISLLSSEALLLETKQIPRSKRRRFALETLALAVRFIETSLQIESRSRTFIEAGIGPLDALHLASAVDSGADVFCTTDDQLLRRGRDVETDRTAVLTPIELIEMIES